MDEQPEPALLLQAMLRAAVQSVRWTYSLFWKLCPQQGILVWSDGYYNGGIKTRKTVQPIEVTTEEATLQRSQQLRELYESLSTGETGRRPSAALSPEDLTESEWFYLMCVSFSFPPGVGLPGQAYAKQEHLWLTGGANDDVHSELFSRAILAKSAMIQTVVCIPFVDGVVELGTTERVAEDIGLIQRVKSLFSSEGRNPNRPSLPALSEHSTSNPIPRFHSPATLPSAPKHSAPEIRPLEAEGDEEEEEEEDERSDSEEVDTHRSGICELLQLDMSDRDIIRLSPAGGSNNLEPEIHLLGNTSERGDLPLAGSMINATGNYQSFDVLPEDDAHYSQTVSAILESQSNRWSTYSSAAISSATSAFAKWTPSSSPSDALLEGGASQYILKYILFKVPLLHRTTTAAPPPHDNLSANHVLAERRRREKIKERFVVLRSLVPFVTKMDKASILGDTIEYVKQLRKRIQDLEAERNRGSCGREQNTNKKKMRTTEDGGAPPSSAQVDVSIIERDALVEISCAHREGLLFDVMQVLREHRLEVTTVRSSTSNGTFTAELRAKLKGNVRDRKARITEVKRSINTVIAYSTH